MKIYTKTGDFGKTALFGGKRVSKSNLRIDAYGTVDELNAYLGLIRDLDIALQYKEFIIQIQKNLFVAGAYLATPAEDRIKKNGDSRLKIGEISSEDVKALENEIDAMETKLVPMTHFVLPGGHVTVSHCHIARTICRRAERLCVALQENEPDSIEVMIYLNRLSDYLFVLARMLTNDLQVDEIKWIPET
ncbi:cob(I)yrinic acid a,c-diamide adenosyltransferase [Wenyingzhuangia sp. IMCC45574]